MDCSTGAKRVFSDVSSTTKGKQGSTSHKGIFVSDNTVENSVQESINAISQDNDEKENVAPFTSQFPPNGNTSKSKRPQRACTTKANVLHMKGKSKWDAQPRRTTSRSSKSRAAVPTLSERDMMETIAGRLLAMRRREAPEDRLARELTVRPLADLSEAYGITESPVVSDEHTSTVANASTRDGPDPEETEEEPLSNKITAANLYAALELSAGTTHKFLILPSLLQQSKRGIKRALDPPFTFAPPQAKSSSSSNTGTSEEPDAILTFSRPTKRMRTGARGCTTPKVTSAELNERNAGIPQNTPAHSRYISTFTDEDVEVPVPMPEFDLPDSISENVPISAIIPGTLLQDVFSTSINTEYKARESEEIQDYTASSFDTPKQGSSHFPSVSDLGPLNVEEHIRSPSRDRIKG